MSKIHVANLKAADRKTILAWADMDIGDVIKVVDDGAGGRAALPLTLAGEVVHGKYKVAMKFSADPLNVHESTVDADSGRELGNRILTIKSGDFIVALGPGSIIEYPRDELDASLEFASLDVGDFLAIEASNSKFALITSGDITTPVIAQVYETFGTKVLVEILQTPITP